MLAIVIGYGSIGARHAALLKLAGYEVRCVTSNSDCGFPIHSTIEEALRSGRPELVIISNQTSRHIPTLQTIRATGYSGTVLIEKPLSHNLDIRLPEDIHPTFVGYNMRFHPVFRKAKDCLANRQIYSAQFYVGQDLRQWRPQTDYRQCYSASRANGGGVLRDLSHELDICQWILGPWKRVCALGGHTSQLEIETDDNIALLMETQRCSAITVQMNYLDQKLRREFIINAEGLSFKGDLISGQFQINDEVSRIDIHRNETFAAQIEALRQQDTDILCGLDEALSVMQLIEAAETSITNEGWVYAQ